MAIQKPEIPYLHLTQLIAFFSVFIPIQFMGMLGYLTRPVLIVCALIAQAVITYWLVCAVRQKKYGYATVMIIVTMGLLVMWYLAWYRLC